MILTRPWLEWRVFGASFLHFAPAVANFITGMRETRESRSLTRPFYMRLRGLLKVAIAIYWAWDSVPRPHSQMLVS